MVLLAPSLPQLCRAVVIASAHARAALLRIIQTHMAQRVGFTQSSAYQGGEGEGHGTFVFSDGLTYVGHWVNNKYEGKGKVDYGNNQSFDGEWIASHQTGKGKQVWASGSTYDGEWKDGLMHGHGVYSLAGGNVYEGQFVDGKKNGKGKLTIVKRNAILEYYEGEFKDDRRHGVGLCKYGVPPKPKGHKYAEFDGHGEMEVGTYNEGHRVGKGVRWSADRSVAWLLQDGKAVRSADGQIAGEIDPAEAVAFAESLGIADPTAEAGAETGGGDDDLQQTKQFDEADAEAPAPA